MSCESNLEVEEAHVPLTMFHSLCISFNKSEKMNYAKIIDDDHTQIYLIFLLMIVVIGKIIISKKIHVQLKTPNSS